MKNFKKTLIAIYFGAKMNFLKNLDFLFLDFTIIYHHVKKAVKANRQLPAKIQPII